MMKSLKILFITAGLVLTSCSKTEPIQWMGDLKQLVSLNDEITGAMRVTDLDGKPISEAQILIGQALNEPFAANFIKADANGNFVAPAAWKTAQTVTLSAPGYLRASFVGQMPAGQTFKLRPVDKEKKFELKGKGTGFKIVEKDDKVDFALMMPILKKHELFAFDASKVVSREVDVIEIYGQKASMPSNISLPKQKEVYMLFTVTLDKPVYRMYFGEPGPQWVYTARGQFPFKKVVKEMQGNKQFLDLINDFSIQGGSLKNINIANDTQNADLPVNELVYNVPVDFVAPAYDPDQTLLAVAVSPFQGSYIATDFKNVPSKGTMKLMTAAGSPPLSLAILQTTPKNNKMDGRVSVSITGFTSTAPNMLPLIENPQVINQNLIKVNALAMPGYINSGGTYSLLSTIEKRTNNDGIAFETLVRVWEVYGADWMSEVVVPVWPNDTALVGKKRWEVSFVGSADKAVDLGPAMLENATHASHAQTDF